MNRRHELLYEQLWGRIDELLGDGRWHDYESTLRELGKLIPPGVAVRQWEQDRRGASRPVAAADMVASGRRSILRVMFKTKRFEFDRPGPAPQRRIRMTRSARLRTGGCPFDARGHNDARVQGPRGALYYVCNLCGRIQRPSQHPARNR